jgi:hypothetical protein
MVGNRKALAYAVNNVTVTKRNTLLRERLAGEFSVPGDVHNVITYPEKSNNQSLCVAEESDYLIKEETKQI